MDSCVSPVPGGISTTRQSNGCHTTCRTRQGRTRYHIQTENSLHCVQCYVLLFYYTKHCEIFYTKHAKWVLGLKCIVSFTKYWGSFLYQIFKMSSFAYYRLKLGNLSCLNKVVLIFQKCCYVQTSQSVSQRFKACAVLMVMILDTSTLSILVYNLFLDRQRNISIHCNISIHHNIGCHHEIEIQIFKKFSYLFGGKRGFLVLLLAVRTSKTTQGVITYLPNKSLYC